MAELSFGEARQVAQNCVNFFRAFEKLRDVLELAAQAEATISEVTRRRDEAQRDLESAVAAKGAAVTAQIEAEELYRRRRMELADDYQARGEQAAKDFEQQKAEQAAELQRQQARAAEALTAAAQDLAALKAQAADAQAELAKAQEELKTVRNILSRIKTAG